MWACLHLSFYLRPFEFFWISWNRPIVPGAALSLYLSLFVSLSLYPFLSVSLLPVSGARVLYRATDSMIVNGILPVACVYHYQTICTRHGMDIRRDVCARLFGQCTCARCMYLFWYLPKTNNSNHYTQLVDTAHFLNFFFIFVRFVGPLRSLALGRAF